MAVKHVIRYTEIFQACTEDGQYKRELVLEDHSLVRIISGELKVIQADNTYTFGHGDTLLFPRNQLSTLIKHPKDGKDYSAVVMIFTTSRLREYYTKNKLETLHAVAHKIVPLTQSPLLDSLFASLMPYYELKTDLPEELRVMKIEEAITILRTINPAIDGILSDFSKSGKINLTDFMEKNYMFNVNLKTFSNLTGRSLTTFKRDFKKSFDTTPQKWLTLKRLELAHYQLSERKRKPMEVYYEMGFENLSHFSYAFKKHFGYPPSMVAE